MMTILMTSFHEFSFLIAFFILACQFQEITQRSIIHKLVGLSKERPMIIVL